MCKCVRQSFVMSGCRPQRKPEELGILGSTYGGPSEFYGAFIQIAHEGQEPSCHEPAFRILRFVDSKKDAAKAQRRLEQELSGTGNILLQMRNNPTLICKDLDRQVSADYVLPKMHAMKTAFLEHIRFVDQDFVANRKDRMEGRQEEAKKRQDEYIQKYQSKGWVKFMRKTYNIRDDVEVIPGSHSEAEEQSKKLNESEQKVVEEVDEDEEDDGAKDDDFPPFPEAAKRPAQKFAAISYILDDDDDMEVLLFIHGVFGTAEQAKTFVTDTLNDMIYPLPVEVVDLYDWIYPVRMTWENNSTSQRVDGLEETCAEVLLQETQGQRREAVEHNRKIKEEATKKKEMHAEVQKELCARLEITNEQFTAILENKQLGTDAIISVCKIEDETKRRSKVQEILSQLVE